MTEEIEQTAPPADEDGYTFLDVVLDVAKHKKVILAVSICAGLIAVVVTLLMPNLYTASMKMLPPQQNQPNAIAMLGQLGATGAIAGNALGLRNTNDLYISMLKSRSVADLIIKRFDLITVYGALSESDAAQILAKRSNIASAKDGLITVSVDDEQPKRAAELANAYLDALKDLTSHFAVTEASQRRVFFEKQHKQANDNLARAQGQLQQFQEKTGLVSEGLLGLTATTSANLRAQITAKEVQLRSMQAFATSQNPELMRAEEELAGLRVQLAKIGNQAGKAQSGVLVSAGNVPKATVEYLQLLREVKYQETLYDLLSRQYEMAKIDEARDGALLQVLDKAEIPEKKSKPHRTLIVLGTALAAAIVAMTMVVFRGAWIRARSNSKTRARIDEIQRHLFSR